MKKYQDNDEIDLIEIFKTIINNKIKIILIVILTIAIAFGLKITEKEKDRQSKFTTKFKAISMLEETQYYVDPDLYVDSITIELNRFTLFDLFMKILDAEKKELVKNFDFIKKENYENEEAYIVALDKIVSSIKISQLQKEKATEGTMEFFSNNEDMSNKWNNFLSTLEYSINKKAQKYFKDVINNKIRNAKIAQNNKTEDIEKEIKTSLKYYELDIKSRLSFLEEQAKIAREGNISGKVVFNSDLPANSTDYSDSLYYLKGYSVIEKEIELIMKRKDPYLYAKNIPLYETRKLEIENDQSIIRQKTKFEATPIYNDDGFLAGSIESTSIQLINNNSGVSGVPLKKMIILAGLIGLIMGIFYVLISSAFRKAMIHDRRY